MHIQSESPNFSTKNFSTVFNDMRKYLSKGIFVTED